MKTDTEIERTRRTIATWLLLAMAGLYGIALSGCSLTTPAGVAMESSEPHIKIHITRGDHDTEISFQGDTVLAEKGMMFEVIDKIQDIHIKNSEWRATHKGKD